MNDFCLAPGITRQDAVEALALLAPALTGKEPLAAWPALSGEKAIFASTALLELLEAGDLQDLSNRLFAAGGMRLIRLGASLVPGGPSRLERLRFNLGAAARSVTLNCSLVRLGDGREILVTAVVDSNTLGRAFAGKRQIATPKSKAPPLASSGGLKSESQSPSRGTDPLRFLWRIDANGRIAEIGPPFSHFAGRPLLDVVDSGDRAQAAALARHLALRATWSCIVSFPADGPGASALVMLAGMPKFDRDRRFEGYSGFGVVQPAPDVGRSDAPRGKKTSLVMLRPPPDAGQADLENDLQRDLRRSQNEARELNAILDTAMDGVAILDSKGNVVSLNRSGEALFGWDESEVAGRPFTVLIAPESRARAQDYFEGLKSDGLISLLNDGREVMALARQGGTIPIFMTLGRIDVGSHLGAGEQDIRFCALLRDMTHWKKIERELDGARKEAERASALKSEFLAKVSHEIRTPLNAILGFAEVILEERFGPIGNARYKDYLRDVHSSGALVMSLVNDLLDLSKIEAGKMDLDFAPVDANRIVTECVSIMQPQASRAGIVIRLSLAPRLPQVFADERSVRQIILNLLSNAVKFNVPGGHVIVATALTESGQAALRIRDTGVGMSAADIEVALEPFGQVAASRVSGGTGLGLPLTKALVEANRASFSIKSERDEGTLVEIAFPPARALAD